MPHLKKILLTSAVFTFGLSAPAIAQDAFNADQQKAVKTLIEKYIQDNPQKILDSLENYRVQQEQEREQNMQSKIEQNMGKLTGPDVPSIGPADAKVTVVEFFDYNCGYCRRALPDIQTTLLENENVRFVFKELPILSPQSAEMAKWALAAHKQDKYFEYHSALMKQGFSKNASGYKKVGSELGLDIKQLEADANSKDIETQLNTMISTARDIGISGTPAFIINGKLYPGYLGEDGLKRAIAEAEAG